MKDITTRAREHFRKPLSVNTVRLCTVQYLLLLYLCSINKHPEEMITNNEFTLLTSTGLSGMTRDNEQITLLVHSKCRNWQADHSAQTAGRMCVLSLELKNTGWVPHFFPLCVTRIESIPPILLNQRNLFNFDRIIVFYPPLWLLARQHNGNALYITTRPGPEQYEASSKCSP